MTPDDVVLVLACLLIGTGVGLLIGLALGYFSCRPTHPDGPPNRTAVTVPGFPLLPAPRSKLKRP